MSSEGSLHALSLLSGRQRSTQHNNLKSLICYWESSLTSETMLTEISEHFVNTRQLKGL